MDRHQINMRMSEQLARVIDEKRMELARSSGTIPTRSDVVRMALAQFLKVDLSVTEIDRRKLPR